MLLVPRKWSLTWFLGTPIPVIGIVQVGSQTRADRYAYIPMIGLLVAAVWLVGEIAAREPRRFPMGRAWAMGIALAACLSGHAG